MTGRFAFIDLAAQQARLRQRLRQAIDGVLAHGQYVLGPEVVELEARLAARCDAAAVVTCASGTDALVLALRVAGCGAGDAVVVPAFTFAATAEAVVLAGATPVFADVDERSFLVDPASVVAACDAAQRAGLTPRGVVAVDLFGQPARYDDLRAALPDDVWIVADAAQSFGASRNGRAVGSLARLSATSFFPSKPLGCYGDGGAVIVGDDESAAALLRSLRNHGMGDDRYDNVRVGMNSRLDTLQAAVLLAKLDIFDDELEARRASATRYEQSLRDVVSTPQVDADATSTWAQYTIADDCRDELAARLDREGVPYAVHYRRPLHRQPAYADYPRAASLDVAERLSARVLSLPMDAYLTPDRQEAVINVVRAHGGRP